MCCSVPLTLHEDGEEGPEPPSDSAVSIAQGMHRASQASQASSVDLPSPRDDHRYGLESDARWLLVPGFD